MRNFGAPIGALLKKVGIVMEKFIPYEKLSKKAKRELDQKNRGTWGNVNPVTRREESNKAYKRHPKYRGHEQDAA